MYVYIYIHMYIGALPLRSTKHRSAPEEKVPLVFVPAGASGGHHSN